MASNPANSAAKSAPKTLTQQYPGTTSPLIVCAPMRLISSPALVHAVSLSGGLGFLGFGIPGTDTSISDIKTLIDEANALFTPSSSAGPAPFGIGFLLITDPSPAEAIALLASLPPSQAPAAVWLFPAASPDTIAKWTTSLRSLPTPPKIWLQVGTKAQVLSYAKLCQPDVLVLQGADAGGHGLAASASIVALVPETTDALREAGLNIPVIAAGGIADGRGVAAATVLGADGVAMGTRFLACPEAKIARGYQDAVLVASDGGVNTVRTRLYDTLRGSKTWPEGYNGRGVVNRSFVESETLGVEENVEKYLKAMEEGDKAWGIEGRATTYAGSAVGLVGEVKGAGKIVEEVRGDAIKLLGGNKD
ncbi:hypothetical protein VE02_02334 [Pseudogymnoascus sp. 03VT05]|nr:hypothetical protein VE02_02334 [Pseudogymnoascus sp. 03VT05]